MVVTAGATLVDPAVATAPGVGEMLADDALVEDHVSVADPPVFTDVGETESEHVGAGVY